MIVTATKLAPETHSTSYKTFLDYFKLSPDKTEFLVELLKAFAQIPYENISKIIQFNLFTFNKNEAKWRYTFQDRPVDSEEFLQHWLDSFDRNSMHGICLSKNIKDGILFVNRTFMRETTFLGKKFQY